MDCQQLIRDQELVNDYVKRIGESFIAESGSKAYPIYDGVMNPQLYAEAKPRIAWVLKEPYDEVDADGTPIGGDWPLSAIYDTENVYDNIKRNLTLNTMSYVTYGIMNNLEYADMPWIYEDPAVANSLKSIVHINISKFPAKTYTSMGNLAAYYETWRPILLFQLKVYKPQVVIFGNVMPYFQKDLGLEEIMKSDDDRMVNYAVKDNCLYIDAWHPCLRGKSDAYKEKYVNGIVKTVMEHASEINLDFPANPFKPGF